MALLRSSAFRILFFASLGAFALLSIPVNSATLSYRWPWTGVYQIGVVLSLLGALVSLKRGSTSGMNWRSGYTLSIIALVAAMTLATGFSDSPHRSAFSLLIPVGALGIGLMTFRFVRDLDNPATGLPRILGCLSLLSIFICGYSLLLWIVSDYLPHLQYLNQFNTIAGAEILRATPFFKQNVHPFGHANFTAGFSVLLLPLTIALALADEKRWRPLSWTAAVLLFATLLSSGSRAGFLAVLAALFAAITLFFFDRNLSLKRWVLVIGVSFTILAAISTTHPRVRTTIAAALAGAELSFSDSERLNLIRTGLRTGTESPVWGNGAGTISILYPRHWNGTGKLSNAYQLHCSPVQVWSDFGVLGVAGFLGLLASILASWFRLRSTLRAESNKAMRTVTNGIGVSLIAYAVFSFTDYQLELISVATVLALYVGTIAALDHVYREVDRPRRNSHAFFQRAATVGAIVLTILFLWMQFSVWQSRKWYDRGQKSYELGNFSQYRKEMERSSGWVPKDAHLLNVWGWQTMRRIDIIGEMETAALAQEAAGYWERSLDVQPDQVFCHYNLGWLYLQSDAEIAARHFRQAAEINPTKRGVYFGLALASKKLGKTEPALRALALECLSRPEFSLLPMWEDSNFLSVRKEVSDLLESFYARIEAEGEVESSKNVLFRQARFWSRWWWRQAGEADTIGDSREAHLKWFSSIVSPSRQVELLPTIEPELGRTPGLIYAAWGDQSKRRTYLDAAYYLSRREPADSAQIDSLSSYLDTPAQAYPDLLRNANASDSLPYNVFQNPAYALGLLSRNLDDPILVDLYVYERNLLLELALEPLFPRHGYIPGSAIRRILNETY